MGKVPGHIQESFSSLRDLEVGCVLGLPAPSPSHGGWSKGYLAWGAKCSQTILQFVSVFHVLGVKAELVPLCQWGKTSRHLGRDKPFPFLLTSSLQRKGQPGRSGCPGNDRLPCRE